MAKAPAFDLSGRSALVTGASSGIGARFARVLAASGCNVALAARRKDALAQAVEEITASGGRAIAVGMDVTDEASTIAAYDEAEAAFGTIDTIVANAGISIEGGTINQSVEDFDKVVAVNMRGVFLTAREGAKRLIAAGSRETHVGRIVISSSITADIASAGLAVYSATKAGVLQMGKVMARDWIRQGINVNMICPGYIVTAMNADWFATEAGRRQIQNFPRRRLMLESDLDVPLLFLASDASRAVTGTAVTVDDGQSLQSL